MAPTTVGADACRGSGPGPETKAPINWLKGGGPRADPFLWGAWSTSSPWQDASCTLQGLVGFAQLARGVMPNPARYPFHELVRKYGKAMIVQKKQLGNTAAGQQTVITTSDTGSTQNGDLVCRMVALQRRCGGTRMLMIQNKCRGPCNGIALRTRNQRLKAYLD